MFRFDISNLNILQGEMIMSCETVLQSNPFGPAKNATKVQKNDWWNCYLLQQITYEPSTDEALIKLISDLQEAMTGNSELTPEFIIPWVEKFHENPKGDRIALELSNALPVMVDTTKVEHIQLLVQNTKLRSAIFSSFGDISHARYADDLSEQLNNVAQLISSQTSK